MNTNVIFIAIFSALFLGERINLKKVIGILAAFIGVFYVFFDELSFLAISSRHLYGNMLGIGSAICWAVYSVLNKSVLKKHDSLITTFLSIGLGIPFLFLYALFFENMEVITHLSIQGWMVLLLSLSSGIAFIIWSEVLKRIEASKAGPFLFTIPIYTILLSHFILGEAITYNIVLGTVAVVAGIYLTQVG